MGSCFHPEKQPQEPERGRDTSAEREKDHRGGAGDTVLPTEIKALPQWEEGASLWWDSRLCVSSVLAFTNEFPAVLSCTNSVS